MLDDARMRALADYLQGQYRAAGSDTLVSAYWFDPNYNPDNGLLWLHEYDGDEQQEAPGQRLGTFRAYASYERRATALDGDPPTYRPVQVLARADAATLSAALLADGLAAVRDQIGLQVGETLRWAWPQAGPDAQTARPRQAVGWECLITITTYEVG